jgi:adenylosuccinate lyase
MAAVKAGADRQEMHELLRTLSMAAWQEVQAGSPNPLIELIQQEAGITRWISAAELTQLFAVEGYTGIAESRAHEMAAKIKQLF